MNYRFSPSDYVVLVLSYILVALYAAGVDLPAFDRVLFALGLKLDEPVAPKAEAPAEVVALAEQRWAAKKAKDFASADRLRGELAAAGWTMLDRKDGYSLEPAKKA